MVKHMFSIKKAKYMYKQAVLNLADIRRIHIVGCSRSGTTMLHYSFIAFCFTKLYDKEISPWTFPTLWEVHRDYMFRLIYRPNPFYLISKRNAPWWQEQHLEKLVSYANKTNLSVINIVRDPRDVLTSKHPLKEKQYYVDTELWMNSIKAGNFLEKHLPTVNFLSIRYEDVIMYPDHIVEQFRKRYQMRLREGVKSIVCLKDNMKMLNAQNNHMVAYMHSLRNLDTNSIGKWKRNPGDIDHIKSLLRQKKIGGMINDFMHKHE